MRTYNCLLIFCKSNTCKDDSAHSPFLRTPYHTLRSFNYLMQDAGIMLGHHLKEAPAFICWDGSYASREERGLCECHEASGCSLQRHTYQCLFLLLSFPVSFSFWLPFFPVQLLCFSPFLWRYAGLRRSQATGRVDGSTWGETTIVTLHFTAYCSQVYTPGTCCTMSSLCVL